MRGIGRGILALVIVLLAGGCSGFRRPAISVQDVAVTEVTNDAVALAFAVDLHNPNDKTVELFEFRYTLAVDGKQVYAGRRAPDANVAAAATQRVSLPAVIPFDRVGWTAEGHPASAGYTLSGRLVYTAPSTIAQLLFDTGVRRPKSAFSKRGELALSSAADEN
ncbi:MAG: LEA type 2 family protein [Planctomycetota bacterium]|jgi:hypothetical protein